MSEYVTVWKDHEPTKLRWGVPVVRCRDCKYMETRGLRCYCAAHTGGYPEVSHDDFCSFGERRDA